MYYISHVGPNNEAIAIANIVSKEIANDPEYADIITIRIQYPNRDSAKADAKISDTVDFRNKPTGVFEIELRQLRSGRFVFCATTTSLDGTSKPGIPNFSHPVHWPDSACRHWHRHCSRPRTSVRPC
jgi:hypothetical protein